MSKREIKEQISKVLDHFSDKALTELLKFLKELDLEDDGGISSKALLNKILQEDDDLLAKQDEYLDKYVFYGLSNLNDGFDAPSIKYFSEDDFEIVLSRVKKLGLGILGIEPWKNGQYEAVVTYDNETDDPTDSNWYMKAFENFKTQDGLLQYSATYFIPEELLK